MWYTAALIRSSLPSAHVPIFWDFLLGCRVHAARLFGQGRVPRNSLFRAALLALHSQPSPRRRVVEHTKRQPKAAHAEPRSGTIFRTVLRSVAPSLEVPVSKSAKAILETTCCGSAFTSSDAFSRRRPTEKRVA